MIAILLILSLSPQLQVLIEIEFQQIQLKLINSDISQFQLYHSFIEITISGCMQNERHFYRYFDKKKAKVHKKIESI